MSRIHADARVQRAEHFSRGSRVNQCYAPSAWLSSAQMAETLTKKKFEMPAVAELADLPAGRQARKA